LIKCWENVTILEEPRLIFQYRCIEIVLQEYLLDNEAYKEMDFHVPEPEFQNGQRVYRNWKSGNWAIRVQNELKKFEIVSLKILAILLFCDETKVTT
jgi:hypothetical protein